MAPGPPNLGKNRFALLASEPHPKRKKPSYTPLNFPELPQSKKENPKFITISATNSNKPISNYSCFAVHKALEAISKEIISISELRNGNLLLLVKNSQIAQRFISAKKLPGVCEIDVKYHDSLNSVKGTIYAPCLNNVSAEEIIENMCKQGVVGVYKFTKTIEGVPQFTGAVLLTFDLYELPDKVDVSWRSAKVKPYFPNPMRCKTCQRLGHTAKRCNNAPTCESCNLPPHPPPCSRILCANCSGDHPSSANTCPKYMQTKEILKIKCQNKCSMREALKLYKAQTPSLLNSSFAEVAKETQKPTNTPALNSKSLPSPPPLLSNKSHVTAPPNISNPPQSNSSLPNNSPQTNYKTQLPYNELDSSFTPVSQTLLHTPFSFEATLANIISQTNSYQNITDSCTLTAIPTDSYSINLAENIPHNNENNKEQTMSADDSH